MPGSDSGHDSTETRARTTHESTHHCALWEPSELEHHQVVPQYSADILPAHRSVFGPSMDGWSTTSVGQSPPPPPPAAAAERCALPRTYVCLGKPTVVLTQHFLHPTPGGSHVREGRILLRHGSTHESTHGSAHVVTGSLCMSPLIFRPVLHALVAQLVHAVLDLFRAQGLLSPRDSVHAPLSIPEHVLLVLYAL